MSDWIKTSDESGDEVWDRTGTIQGHYRSRKENVGPNNSFMYMIDTGKKLVGVWGSTVLDTRLAQVPVGSEVRIKSLGKAKSEKTGREYDNYEVEYRQAPFVAAGAPTSQPSAPTVAGDDEPPIESRDPEDVDLDNIPF